MFVGFILVLFASLLTAYAGDLTVGTCTLTNGSKVNLNIRQEPSVGSQVVKLLTPGESVEALYMEYDQSSNSEWFYVGSGYVYFGVVSFEVSCLNQMLPTKQAYEEYLAWSNSLSNSVELSISGTSRLVVWFGGQPKGYVYLGASEAKFLEFRTPIETWEISTESHNYYREEILEGGTYEVEGAVTAKYEGGWLLVQYPTTFGEVQTVKIKIL